MAKVQLTKSRFKVGAECPTKLHYLDSPEYGNTNLNNAFLRALAEGGFQVGELAKQYFPGGVEVATKDKARALDETRALLERDNVIIFEAALAHQNLFIRADILVKTGSSFRLIEVKAKSYDPTLEEQFFTKASVKKGPKKIASNWQPYILDIAFQCHVARLAYPKVGVSGALMLADKSVTASVDGLNQRFALEKDEQGRVSARVSPGTTLEDLGRKILVEVDANEAIAVLTRDSIACGSEDYTFVELVGFLSETCATGAWVTPALGAQCKGCEFRLTEAHKGKSGFAQCWSNTNTPEARPYVFDIWNFRKAQALIDRGTPFMDEVTEKDIAPAAKAGERGLSSSERQWLQVEKARNRDATAYLDVEGLAAEFAGWAYPLHFIDFETTMVAIPFHAGRRPYEQIAFQFSHHRVDANGTITHATEYLNREKGKFPNFDFVRALKRALGDDRGTIFRYAAHENVVLNQIKTQLLNAIPAPPDRDELVEFISSITDESPRSMVDLCELVKRYYYAPAMQGSNSIKKVLPAILNGSPYLQAKYAAPIYGAQIASRNFNAWAWITKDERGQVIDPYKRLPPIFTDLDLEEMDTLITEGSIADGGAAMTAYARMQFTQMSDAECARVAAALLKYCELDTFAMVLIWEHWREELRAASTSRAG